MASVTEAEKEIFAKAEQEFGKGRVGMLRASGHFVVYRACTLDERTRWHEVVERSSRALANEQMARSVTVYPAGDTKIALFVELPFLLENVTQRSQNLAGGKVEDLGND
jgi:hypothetical protein